MMTLQAEWAVSDGELRVAYRLRNRHPVRAFAYTVPRTARRHQPRPGSAYALLSPGDLDLTLLLGTCDPPAGVAVPVRIQPLARAVPPGGELAGEVQLPVPVVEWGAYSDPDAPGEGREQVPTYRLLLVVEYVLEGETYFCRQTPGGDTWDVGGTPVRRVAATHVPDHPIPVLKRLDGPSPTPPNRSG
jgi:hypothetical protein